MVRYLDIWSWIIGYFIFQIVYVVTVVSTRNCLSSFLPHYSQLWDPSSGMRRLVFSEQFYCLILAFPASSLVDKCNLFAPFFISAKYCIIFVEIVPIQHDIEWLDWNLQNCIHLPKIHSIILIFPLNHRIISLKISISRTISWIEKLVRK